MHDDTRRLAEKATQGDITAFGALVERYQGMVYGLALDSVKRFADAEDIAQDTFVAAYLQLKTLRAPGRFAAWLRGIAANKIGTWLRKQKGKCRLRRSDRKAMTAFQPEAQSMGTGRTSGSCRGPRYTVCGQALALLPNIWYYASGLSDSLPEGKRRRTMGKNQHVVPRKGGWAVKREGSSRAGSTHRTQREAIETARDRARNERSEVVIHRPDGTIRDKDSYGNDPCPPRDRKH